MGRLAGFRYRDIVKRLKELGLQFDRQARGSHEIWCNPITHRYTTIPNHPDDMPEGTLRTILMHGRSLLRRIPAEEIADDVAMKDLTRNV